MKEKSRTPATKKIARERIAVLFAEAKETAAANHALSNRYVSLARTIAMRQRIRIDHEYRRQFCHHCSSYLVPGKTMRVRVHDGRVVVTCRTCGRSTRYRIVKRHEESV